MNIFLSLSLFLLPIFFLLVKRRRSSDRLPPGSLGIPIIGQSLSFLWAMRANTADRWIAKRAKRYGPISKLSLFGKPAVFIHGQAANKCLSELSGEDHKRVRSALASFLKPECLKLYIGKMEEEVRRHLEMHWNGKQNITVLPLMKTLTFNIICTLLFGVERGARRDKLVRYFQEILEGLWSIPVNFPFTRFNRGLKASAKVQSILKNLVREKRDELKKAASSHQDLITSLLNIRGEDDRELVSEDEIVHNIMLIMVAGHDTSAVLISFIVRLLANDPAIYAAILKGIIPHSLYSIELLIHFRAKS
ncbi:Cytochrome [Forsythia ovata]|uniref:Cytochrome n=1 Tax=Forsythia ovata TaxID=205694 RepID=A0ABD1Q9Y1_9LAMI